MRVVGGRGSTRKVAVGLSLRLTLRSFPLTQLPYTNNKLILSISHEDPSQLRVGFREHSLSLKSTENNPIERWVELGPHLHGPLRMIETNFKKDLFCCGNKVTCYSHRSYHFPSPFTRSFYPSVWTYTPKRD